MEEEKLIDVLSENIQQTLEEYEVTNDIIIEPDLISTIKFYPEKNIFDEALKTEFHSEEELKAKKVLSAAMVIAKKKNILPEEISNNLPPVTVASIADETVNKNKVAYKVGNNQIDVYEAADKMIDYATARMLAVSDKVVKQGVDFAINKIGVAVASVCPNALPVVATIKYFQPWITEKTQKAVKSGIKSLNTWAKKSLKKIGEKVSEFAINYTKNKVSAVLRSL